MAMTTGCAEVEAYVWHLRSNERWHLLNHFAEFEQWCLDCLNYEPDIHVDCNEIIFRQEGDLVMFKLAWTLDLPEFDEWFSFQFPKGANIFINEISNIYNWGSYGTWVRPRPKPKRSYPLPGEKGFNQGRWKTQRSGSLPYRGLRHPI